ncbi:AAA family ATPase [Tersicoccus phoenicis]|uniref:AAA family ATPase n=1 Tax=Tersicoccus phoenicis TaxID=554083 RepID=UPI0013562E5B|nr:ATP-binding protein [Tersicoccus phoenicis]
MSRLIVIAGLPGVGKTSVASELAVRLNGVHLSVDAVEESILGSGLPHGWHVGVAAYEATRAMAELNLQLGHDVVVDAVSDSEAARQTWRDAASATDAVLRFVHLVVSDLEEHRRRLFGRDRGFTHVAEPSWQDVQLRRAEYAPWTDDRLEIDAVAMPAGAIADDVVARVGRIVPLDASETVSRVAGPARPEVDRAALAIERKTAHDSSTLDDLRGERM